MRCESQFYTRIFKSGYIKVSVASSQRYQDIHNQSYIMVMASGRWLGVRLDVIISLLIGTVALAAVLASQEAGKYNHGRSVLYCNTKK